MHLKKIQDIRVKLSRIVLFSAARWYHRISFLLVLFNPFLLDGEHSSFGFSTAFLTAELHAPLLRCSSFHAVCHVVLLCKITVKVFKVLVFKLTAFLL